MTTLLPRSPAAGAATTPTGADVPLREAVPWVVREAIAPRLWREDGACWLESNGSAGCYGGWELRFPVEALEGDALVFELQAGAQEVVRGADALVVEAFWHDAGGGQRDWDPVPFDGGASRSSFAVRLRCPAGAAELRVRCGLRWSPTGRVRWHGWRLYPVAPAPPRRLRLGVASARPGPWVDLWTNRDHWVTQCRRAGAAGVGLVCLPELALTAGMPRTGTEDVIRAALPVPGEWLEPFREVARREHLGICFSTYERAGERDEIVYNTAVLLGQDGGLIGTYRKVHLALAEARNGVAAGHELPVYDFHGIGVGMLICMDSTPPESSRVLARKGADIVLMPIMGDFRANRWAPRGQPGAGLDFDEDRWRLIQRAHAFDNHVYTAVARNGTLGSSVTAPWGEILAWDGGAGAGAGGLIWADVDPDDRRRHPTGSTMRAVMWSMRRPAVYDSLTDAALPGAPPAVGPEARP